MPAVEPEDAAPSWFDPFPGVQISEFESWSDVVNWALPLYQVKQSPSGTLAQEIDRLKNSSDKPEARLISALRFVQDEIRYMGIELGPNSHQPNQPSTVFERRFGDCKDKSLLLSSILNSIGIEAHPALVNTEAKSSLSAWQPTPIAFDHCIVQAKIAGKTYWIDPTISMQRGQLDQYYAPDYALALVIRDGGHELERIPLSKSETRERRPSKRDFTRIIQPAR